MTKNKLFSTKFDLPERDNGSKYPLWIEFRRRDIYSSNKNEEGAMRTIRSEKNKDIIMNGYECFPENDNESKSTKPPSALDTTFEDSWFSDDDDDDDTLTVSLSYYRPPMIDDTTTQQGDRHQDITRNLLFDCNASGTDSALELVDTLKKGCKLCNKKIMGLVDKLSVVSRTDADEGAAITDTQEDCGVEITLDNYKK